MHGRTHRVSTPSLVIIAVTPDCGRKPGIPQRTLASKGRINIRLLAQSACDLQHGRLMSSVDGSRGARGDLTFLTIGSGAVFCPAC